MDRQITLMRVRMGELSSEERQMDNIRELNMTSTTDGTPKQLLSRFYALQEERVEAYNLFEEGFQAYLKGAPNYNFPLYRQLVHEITETFNKISHDVLTIKTKFAEQNNLLPIADIIDKIQTAEQKKLELTAKLQIYRQKHQDEPSEETDSQVETVKLSLTESRDYIVEQMEDLKYESEDIYNAESEPETATLNNTESDPTTTDSNLSAER